MVFCFLGILLPVVFLLPDGDSHEPVIYKMDRLPLGARCSPFVAMHTVRRIAEDTADKRVIKAVRENVRRRLHQFLSFRRRSFK